MSDSAARVPHEVVEGCVGCPHPDYCAGMGECDRKSPLVSPETEAKLAEIGVSLFTIPAPTGEELHRLEGWRDNIERYGQDLWAIYHWIVKAQDGKTHGVYALAQWLEDWGVPDKTTQSGDFEEVYRARRS